MISNYAFFVVIKDLEAKEGTFSIFLVSLKKNILLIMEGILFSCEWLIWHFDSFILTLE